MQLPDERFAKVGELELCYEEFGPEDGEPMLLVMGLATQMLGWHRGLLRRARRARLQGDPLRQPRHRPLHDPRGRAGAGPGPDALRLRQPAYRLTDLAADAAGLLDALELDSAHVVGASMGGMIGQLLAIEHPERVRSLGSIMSGPGTLATRLPRLRAFGTLMRRAPKGRDAAVDHTVRLFGVIGSPGFERDEDELREIAGLSYDRSHDPRGIARQLHAITSSKPRAKSLRQVRLPALVIHGDKDPLVRYSAGKATAKAIPGARLVTIEGMGHDLPRGAWPLIVEAIADNAARAAGTRRSAAPVEA